MITLTLERKDQPNETGVLGTPAASVLIAPLVDADYWAYRVVLTPRQAILGFPKYSTIGIGFAVEEDWNTNLPYHVEAERIWDHIKHNKGDRKITRAMGIQAIEMIQEAVKQDRGEGKEG